MASPGFEQIYPGRQKSSFWIPTIPIYAHDMTSFRINILFIHDFPGEIKNLKFCW